MAGLEGEHPEFDAVDLLRRLAGTPTGDDVWIGDDAAVVSLRDRRALFATDISVEGVHFDRRFGSLADVGWRALVQNLSDIAAMGGVPNSAVVAISGATATDLTQIYEGLFEASQRYSCPVVGGDLSDGDSLIVSVAILGETAGQEPVLRSGAQPGDQIVVSGQLGAAAAGLRLLRSDPRTTTGPLVDAFLRPTPRMAAGRLAALAGATAMIDISDGLGIDLHRLADASGVGFVLDEVPVAAGATIEDALGGGEDYELVFSVPELTELSRSFANEGLPAPVRIGEVVADPKVRLVTGEPLAAVGFEHRLGR